MENIEINHPTRQAAVHGLAVVGFLTLIALGISLAIYSARYVPSAIGRLGAAAVSLSQIFTPAPSPSLSVVPAATSTVLSFGNATTTEEHATTTSTGTAQKKLDTSDTSAARAAGSKTDTTYQLGSATGTPALSGLPDLIVTISAVGYLTSSSTDSFVAATSVPHGASPAVKFIVKNIGTNSTGAWRFSASIPTSSNSIYQSMPQQSLNPGDYIEYTLGFSQPTPGADKMISVTANFDAAVAESNANNNSASTKITVLGS